MSLFEGYERRIAQIEKCCKEYGIANIEEADKICKDKGIVDLLDAVALLKRAHPKVSLCVIGSGEIQEFKDYALKIGIQDNVVWAGFQSTREDVHRLALQARVAVLPTYYDMFPGLIVESMFLGIPVVSTDIPCNREINQQGEVIQLVPVGDVAVLADRIGAFLNNDAMCAEYAERARARAYEMFVHSKDKLSQALMTGYQLSIEMQKQETSALHNSLLTDDK